jgi:fumarate reductase subunit C
MDVVGKGKRYGCSVEHRLKGVVTLSFMPIFKSKTTFGFWPKEVIMLIFGHNKTGSRVAAYSVFAVVAFLLVIAGCTKNYGHFARSAQVEQAFRNGEHQSDYQYFYAGRDTMPYAIIGVDRGYTVPSRYWIPFEPEPEELRKMTGNMYGKHRFYPTGYQILDPDGAIIGVWFSSVYFQSVSVDPQNRTVEVLFRNPENSHSLSVGNLGRLDRESDPIGS